MDVLSEIIATRRKRLTEAQSRVKLEAVKENAAELRAQAKSHLLAGALATNAINIIAEFKRRSPSKGVLSPEADAVATARAYESGGAAAISVLTEEDYFGGSLDDLRAVRAAVSLPILRKDFVFDEYQAYESAAAGADALLLIVAVLDDETLWNLRRIAEDELGMDALVEVHSSEEMARSLAAGAKLIGVNNRNLRTFETSLATSFELAREVPADVILVAESGLNAKDDLRRLREVGYKGFLIGEALMRAPDPDEALRSLIA
jgi:indole-3-glycerol phosphate synthase